MAKKKKEIPEKTGFNYEGFESEAIHRMRQGDALLGEGGIFTEMLQNIVNSALEGELDHHLKEETSRGVSNRRNGHTSKKVRSTGGPLNITPPRDRLGNYDPQLVKKWDRELGTGLDGVILSLYARGNSNEDICRLLYEMYGLEYSKGSISMVTERVWQEVTDWQQRPLSSCYPIVYLDAIHYKVRDQGKVELKAVYTVFGVDTEGHRDVLGLFVGASEGARQWGLILEDLSRRGVEDVLFFCVDGLKGFREVIEEVFPRSVVQRCVVHMIRSSTRFVSGTDRKKLCADLRKVYTAATSEQAVLALEAFGSQWDAKYKEVRQSWESNWEDVMAFMDYKGHIRRMIYTTNPVEALHRVMRKVTKAKGAWVSEKSLQKQLYLALKYSEKSWKKRALSWGAIQRELVEKFGDRYGKWLE